MARTNSEHSLTLRRNSNSNILSQLEALQGALELPDLPERIECFDISHTGGEETVGSCVVFTREGMRKYPKETKEFMKHIELWRGRLRGVTKELHASAITK